ncbi:hypothetical protein [Thermocoleostomius sinensis]|uniref:Uncharacterized protein n=1 Tax=Thermocoleostomius sinensis A174 TaxID=2016057 RepID=A0A9E8ZDI9_9CYAN|nr:hypothetical protein [Thermocoleostomius sinensis]WAL60831.1 hypothetical protein OXH18_02205 [Thermocoleostomius sinensis A174]
MFEQTDRRIDRIAQLQESNARAIESNSAAIAQLREDTRVSFERTMTALQVVAQAAQRNTESIDRLEQLIEILVRRDLENGNGAG